ncbi:MAG TPA: hypothetical protein VI793_22320 [Anaerolineales bacterium]|nr:hypothetical protein [Anaerolineales bacterium]
MQLVTRADWDGVICAVLLGKIEKVDGVFFAYPHDVQEGNVTIPPDCIIANLPYHPGCAMWFDHHISELDKAQRATFKGRFGLAPSAARLVYEYYGGAERFPEYAELIEVTDRIDSAYLTMDDVTKPQGYVLLAYTADPRTGLKQSHEEYFLVLVELLKTHPLEKIMAHPEVKSRCERILAEEAQFRKILSRHSRQEEQLVITDLRGLGDVPPGNRFLIYALFPGANISMRLFDGREGQTVVALGHSIFNRTSRTNIGELLSRYSGGGHAGAGTAQLPDDKADAKISEIIANIKADG